MTTDHTTYGFAVTASGTHKPIVSTVAETERGAMVNALVAVYGHMVFAGDSDATIKAAFARNKTYGHEVITVAITPVERG